MSKSSLAGLAPLVLTLAGSLLVATLSACAKPPPPAALPAADARTTNVVISRPAADPCAVAIDLRDLLARHAAAFGSEAQIDALSPRRVSGTVDMNSMSGTSVQVYDRERFTSKVQVGGLIIESGIDPAGPWSHAPGGVVEPLLGDEGMGERYELWLANRRYLSTLDATRDQVRCEVVDGVARGTVKASLPELGDPRLSFELASARLLSSSHGTASGSRVEAHVLAWSAAQSGVRWPSEWSIELDGPVRVKDIVVEPGVACDESCFARPAGIFSLRWPRAERVSVPLSIVSGQLLVPIRVGERKSLAKLDSNAGLNLVDARSPLDRVFKASSEAMAGPSQRFKLGTLEAVAIGGLLVPRLPAGCLPMAGLDAFGKRRPELVLGTALFNSAAVRIDYARKLLTIARSADKLHRPSELALPIQVWGHKIVVAVELDGQPRFVRIDTGNSGGLKLFESLRAQRVTLGPIVVEDPSATPGDPATAPKLVGLVGNELLSRCAAVIFDVPQRKVWLEPPCR